MGKLIVSVYGPFVTMLDRDPIEIYAPRCTGHYASIFSTENEAPLEIDRNQGMKRYYSVSQSGIQPNTTAINRLNPASLLTPPPGYVLSNDVKRAWFCLQFPRPGAIAGISQDMVDIVGTKAPPKGQSWATALRLVFDYDLSKPDFKMTDGAKEIFSSTLVDYGGSNQLDLTVRFTGPILMDPDHDDAKSCFESSCQLFQDSKGVALDWELDYTGITPNKQKISLKKAIAARVGTDCGAPGYVCC